MDIIAAALPVALGEAKKLFKKYLQKDQGSKVKKGAFAEASIEMYGNQACIQLDKAGRNVLLLTSDNVRSYEYVKEKKKAHGLTVHKYYYYTIYYTDGSSSYVRMRKKYRDAMERYC